MNSDPYKYKFLNAVVKNRKSIVMINKNHKIYTGVAYYHPEEKNPQSEYVGCDLAEHRALIKALKYELRQLIKEKDVLEKSYHHCCCYKNFNINSFEARIFRKEIYIKNNIIKQYKIAINNANQQIDYIIAGLEIHEKGIAKKNKLNELRKKIGQNLTKKHKEK